MNNNIGKRIKFYRMQAGITQKELCTALGYKHHSSIGRIEDGTNDVPLSILEKMANIFGVSPVAFFNPCPVEFDEYVSYLMNAEEWQLKAVREILHMPEKREDASGLLREAQ